MNILINPNKNKYNFLKVKNSPLFQSLSMRNKYLYHKTHKTFISQANNMKKKISIMMIGNFIISK